MKNMNEGLIAKALDYGYEKAVNGLPGLDTAQELAQDYLEAEGTVREKARSLVHWQTAKACASGFVTGLGGALTLPVALPANITSVLYVQLRMIAAIAVMGKYNLKNDKVRALVYMCLCGNAAGAVIKDIGIEIGKGLGRQAIKRVSREVIAKINAAVGRRVLTRSGQTGLVNLGKALPLIGGLIGGSFDGASTKAVGEAAIRTFL